MSITILKSTSEKALIILTTLLILVGAAYFVNAIQNVSSNPNMPVDQALRYWEIKSLFFEGKNVFIEENYLVYPPSFLLLMTPLLALFSYETSKWVWLIVQIISLISISYVVFRIANRSLDGIKSLFISSIFIAWHSSYQAIGIGQLPVVLMAMFLVCLFFLTQSKKITLWKKIIISIFLTIALGKYTIFLPFYVFLAFDSRFKNYIILSFILNFVLSSIILFSFDLSYYEYLNSYLAKYSGGYSSGSVDLHSILKNLDVTTSSLIALTLLMLCIPVYLGWKKYSLPMGLVITAIIGRFWMYHGIYDNVMLLPLLILLVIQLKQKQWNLATYSSFTLTSLLILPARFWDAEFFLSPILHAIFPLVSLLLVIGIFRHMSTEESLEKLEV